MEKNISDLVKPALEIIAAKQADGLSALQAHKALIEASLAKEKRRNPLKDEIKDEIIESKTLIPSFLPLCSDGVRAVPNAVLRGALFGVVEKGRRKYEKNVCKATVSGLTIKFTGEQLDQADLDVWAECLCLNQGSLLGKEIYFSSNSFLAAIGRTVGKSNRDWLHSCFRRLMTSLVELSYEQYCYSGQLLHHWYRDEKTGRNCLVLNQKLLPFFQKRFWTGLSIEQRCLLKGKPLAQWLHSFYSTHSQPFPYKVETLMSLCGSGVAVLKKFRQMLKKSLVDLSNATGWKCSIQDNDLVEVKKN